MKKVNTFLFQLMVCTSCFAGGGEQIAILRDWASYAGISDSTFKTPMLTDGDYTYVATVDFDSITGPDIRVIKYNGESARIWEIEWTDQVTDGTRRQIW